jgi:hypothetical protein
MSPVDILSAWADDVEAAGSAASAAQTARAPKGVTRQVEAKMSERSFRYFLMLDGPLAGYVVDISNLLD